MSRKGIRRRTFLPGDVRVFGTKGEAKSWLMETVAVKDPRFRYVIDTL